MPDQAASQLRDTPEPSPEPEQPKDASIRDVFLYAFGNIESGISNQFFAVLNSVLIVALHVNPLLLGLLGSIKTLWDAITDPVMAYITDNTRSRWGRRRPYILIGGVLRSAILLVIVACLPSGGRMVSNQIMEAQKFTSEAISLAEGARQTVSNALERPPKPKALSHDPLFRSIGKALDAAQSAQKNIASNADVLREDLADREADLQMRQDALAAIQADPAKSNSLKRITQAEGAVTLAEQRVQKARELIDKSVLALRQAIAAEFAARHILATLDPAIEPHLASREAAAAAAAEAYAKAGLDPLDPFTADPPKPPPLPGKPLGMFSAISDGITAFNAPENAEQRGLVIYLLVALLIFTTLTTIQSVPYYALGIELCPSYDGRTRVVTFRSIVDKITGLIGPWVPVFCFSLLFTNALQGLFWVAIAACAVGIPSTIIMCWFIKERTQVSASQTKPAFGVFTSMFQIAKSWHFLRICGLYCLIGLTNGVFGQLGFFLNVYWVMGSALSGATLGAWISMVAWGLGLVTLPLIHWGCKKFQKHRMLTLAIIWMAIGTAIKWWAMDPDHPEYQFVLPFFFSVGIGSVYMVLPTLMADVTDVDELEHGFRREGMFGAVMAFIQKFVGTLTPILAGAILVASGFDASLEYHQTPETIFKMRLFYSFVPAGMLMIALLLLWRYPLTRERIAEIKAKLAQRHAAEA